MGDSRLITTLYSVIILILSTSLAAGASIKQFSGDLTPTQETVTATLSAPTKVYKASISQSKLSELKTAVLWHAPTYKSLSLNFSPSQQIQIDEEAIQILINGAAERNEDIMKAKNIISKKEPLVFKIGQLLMSREIDNEESVTLSHWDFNGRGKDEASSLISQVSSYLYLNYQHLKPFYQMTLNRDNKSIERYHQAQAKLELISGAEAVANVQSLLNGGRT